MKFTKMQGIGNDYVYVNCFQEEVEDPSALAIRVSDRHFGVGSDGLILIRPSDKADFWMDMYNADGSSSAMCGNGMRCVGKYVYEYGLTDKTSISVESGGEIKYLDMEVKEGKVVSVTVDMGQPILEAARIPLRIKEERAVAHPITVGGKDWTFTGISMGNPHAVVYVDRVEDMDLEEIGPKFEHHDYFPERVNTEFVKVIDQGTLQMRVWERGSGETMACGTGACAVAVASAINGYTGRDVTVRLLGGELRISWREDGHVYMTGPAALVFDGELYI